MCLLHLAMCLSTQRMNDADIHVFLHFVRGESDLCLVDNAHDFYGCNYEIILTTLTLALLMSLLPRNVEF